MIQTFDEETDTETIVSALNSDGGVIVANQADHELVDQVAAELRPHFDEQGHRFSNDFNGYKTLRLGGGPGTVADLRRANRPFASNGSCQRRVKATLR